MQQSRNSRSSGLRSDGYLSTRPFQTQRETAALPPQQAAKRAAHQRAPDRTTERAADRFAEIGSDTADDLVGDRARNIARDHLAGRHLAALDVGAEDRADDRTDLAENAATTILSVRRRRRAGHALLQHLIGGFGVDSRVVFALERT